MKKILLLTALILALSISMFSITFPGEWTLHYDWTGSDDYSKTTIIYNTNGNFTAECPASHQTLYGTWYQQDSDHIVFIFLNGAVFSGSKVGGAMVGMMGDPNYDDNGAWYAIKKPNGYQLVSPYYTVDIDGTHVSNNVTPIK